MRENIISSKCLSALKGGDPPFHMVSPLFVIQTIQTRSRNECAWTGNRSHILKIKTISVSIGDIEKWRFLNDSTMVGWYLNKREFKNTSSIIIWIDTSSMIQFATDIHKFVHIKSLRANPDGDTDAFRIPEFHSTTLRLPISTLLLPGQRRQ